MVWKRATPRKVAVKENRTKRKTMATRTKLEAIPSFLQSL
jgi:hypothetical protein